MCMSFLMTPNVLWFVWMKSLTSHVMDNLNTHKRTYLYKRYSPDEARRIIKKLKIHYMPKHGSRLDIAEIELNIMTQQCLSRRTADIELLRSELSTCEMERNKIAISSIHEGQASPQRLFNITLYG